MEIDTKPTGGADGMDDVQNTTTSPVVEDPNALPAEANETIYIQNVCPLLRCLQMTSTDKLTFLH